MKPQTPAEGISSEAGFDDAHIYHIECSCTDPDHAIACWVEIEPDSDINEINVTFYTKQSYQGWKSWKERFWDAASILFGKSLQREHTTLLTAQSALNFSAALEKSIEDLKNKG